MPTPFSSVDLWHPVKDSQANWQFKCQDDAPLSEAKPRHKAAHPRPSQGRAVAQVKSSQAKDKQPLKGNAYRPQRKSPNLP